MKAPAGHGSERARRSRNHCALSAAVRAVVWVNKTLTSAVINGDSAQYYFEDVIGGETITFPVEFVKENGVWKILEF